MERRKVGFGSPSLPLRIMTGPTQHFYSSILDAWRFSVFAELSERKGFRGVDYADFQGSLQLLTSSHLKDKEKMLLRVILCGGVWNGFLLGRARRKMFPASSVAGKMVTVICLWECTFPPLLHVRELPEFSSLMALDRSKWPRCLLWHGWLPGLSCSRDRGPLGRFFWSAGLSGTRALLGCLSGG